MSSGTKCHGPLRHRAGRQARRSSQSSWWLPGDQCHPDKRRPPGGCALMGLSLPGGLWVLLAEASLPHKEPHWSLLSSLSSPEAKETWQPSQRPGSGPPPPPPPPCTASGQISPERLMTLKDWKDFRLPGPRTQSTRAPWARMQMDARGH